jgi:Tfp pilus assembly protein PilN
MADSQQELLNFRKEEFSLKSASDLKAMFIYMLSGMIFLFLLFTFGLYQDIFYLDKKHTELKEEIKGIYATTFPDSGDPIKGRELALMKQKIETEAEKYKWLDEINGKGKVIDVIKELTNMISLHRDVKIHNFAIEENVIHLDGRASSFETVDRLKESFSASRLFTTVSLLGAKSDKRDKSVRFNFSMETGK